MKMKSLLSLAFLLLFALTAMPLFAAAPDLASDSLATMVDLGPDTAALKTPLEVPNVQTDPAERESVRPAVYVTDEAEPLHDESFAGTEEGRADADSSAGWRFS